MSLTEHIPLPDCHWMRLCVGGTTNNGVMVWPIFVFENNVHTVIATFETRALAEAACEELRTRVRVARALTS